MKTTEQGILRNMSDRAGQPTKPKADDWIKGPLPNVLGEFPLQFSTAVLVADLSSGGPWLYNGTATLNQLGSKKLAITCWHVIEKYRELWKEDRRSLFQVGNVRFEPIPQLVAEDQELDLATIELTDDQADSLMKHEGMGREFFLPVEWPPSPVKDTDWVALGGYPGVWRERVGWNVVEFKGYSLGSTPVTSVSDYSIGCQFARDRWVWVNQREGLPEVKEAGMSGGPAFVLRALHWEFAGIIYEFSPTFDIMFLRPAHLINIDGSICSFP